MAAASLAYEHGRAQPCARPATRETWSSLRRRHGARTLLLDPVDQHGDRGGGDYEAERDDGGGAEHEIEAAAGVKKRDQRDGCAGYHEGEKVAHRVDAPAPG